APENTDILNLLLPRAWPVSELSRQRIRKVTSATPFLCSESCFKPRGRLGRLIPIIAPAPRFGEFFLQSSPRECYKYQQYRSRRTAQKMDWKKHDRFQEDPLSTWLGDIAPLVIQPLAQGEKQNNRGA